MGCLLFVISAFLASLITLGIALGMEVIMGNQQLAAAFGMATGMMSFMLMMMYGSLLTFRADDSLSRPAESVWQRWRREKQELKLQGAEIRVGFVFAMIAGGAAGAIEAPNWAIGTWTILAALLGAAFGYDFKRRALRLRQSSRTNPELND